MLVTSCKSWSSLWEEVEAQREDKELEQDKEGGVSGRASTGGGGCAGGVGGGGQESPHRLIQEVFKAVQLGEGHDILSWLPGVVAFQHGSLEPGVVQLTHQRAARVALDKQARRKRSSAARIMILQLLTPSSDAI